MNWKLIRLAIVLFVFGAAFGYLTCPNCYEESFQLGRNVSLYTASLWVMLWLGNAYTQGICDKYIDWLVSPRKRLFVGLLVAVIYTVSSVLLLTLLFEHIGQFSVDFGNSISGTLIFSTGISIIIWLFFTGKEFLFAYRQIAVNAEKLHTENITSRFEALKSQVNPHFLFNSLNSLSDLVYEDADLAAKFIKQLSEVYRYVLDSREKDLVPLDEELKFLHSYLFLQKIRFGEKLQFEVNLPNSSALQIPPVSLQILAENALKHNIVSQEDPLQISIFQEGNYLIFRNNLQKKTVLKEESAGIGLANIEARFEILSHQKVQIEEAGGYFTVKLPLIKPL
ncbi:sensor histidine kinase [Peijinzhouia sedimentorum]